MPGKSDSDKVFLQIGFRSSEREGSLRTIELCGVPGEKSSDGQYAVNEKTQRFFDDLIVRKIFRDSRHFQECNFEHLKIWLYDTDITNENRGYEIPVIDKKDFLIHSSFRSSTLERIYVLDNSVDPREYGIWKRNAEDLFTPLFSKFITPPETPDILKNIPLFKFVEDIAEKVDPHLKMRQDLLCKFNALIIQID